MVLIFSWRGIQQISLSPHFNKIICDLVKVPYMIITSRLILLKTWPFINIRGIKHAFPFINIHKVPREVLKTEDKINFDRYYCINSTKTLQN